MTATAQLTEWQTVGWEDVPRDHWGRPLVTTPGGERPTPYTRATTYVSALEDTYNLGRWQMRMVASGLASRPDLLLRVSSLGEEPPKLVLSPNGVTYAANPRYPAWRTDMDSTCDAAQEAARAHAKATVGTALHALCERMDNGEDTGIVPVDYLPHLGAYAHITDGWEYLAVERFMVCDPLKIGGTPDRIARVPGLSRPVITDIKTGDLTYGMGKIAMQLAVYAHSVYYHHPSGVRVDPPEGLDQEMGLVVSLDATTGLAEVLQVDIGAGWEAVQLATQVRAWRARRGLLKPWAGAQQHAAQLASPPPAKAESPETTALDFLLTAIRMAKDQATLTQIWRANRQSWSPELTAAASARKAEIGA